MSSHSYRQPGKTVNIVAGALMETVNVLLIEDHEGEARLNQRLLERSHTMEFRFTNRRTLAEAQEALADSAFDVMLLDLNLPDSSGLETYSKLQQHAQRLPVVIISAVADDRLAAEAIRRGAQDYLVKGNITSEIMTRVVRYAMARMEHVRATGDTAGRMSAVAAQATARPEGKDAQADVQHADTASILAASESKYRTLIEHSQDGVFIVRDGIMLFVNRALEEMTGYASDEMIGQPMTEFIAPEDRKAVTDRHMQRMAGEDVTQQYTLSLLHRGGTRRRAMLSVDRIPYEDGHAAMGTVKDITQQERIAYLLRIQHQLALDLAYTNDAEAVYEHMLKAVLRVETIDCAGVHILDPTSGRYHSMASRGVRDVFRDLAGDEEYENGYQRLIRESASVFLSAEELRSMSGLRRLPELGVQCLGLIPVTHAGRVIAALGVCSLTFSECDPIIRQAIESAASYLGGVLARIAAEEALKDSEQLYRAVVDKSHDAIFIYRDDRLLFANERTVELTGYSRDELMQLNAWSLVHPEDRARIQDIARSRSNADLSPIVYEGRVLTKDGTIRAGEFATTIIRYQHEPAALVTVRDITSRKSQEEDLRRSDALLRSSGFAAARFLRTADWESCIGEVLEHYGAAANVCRVLLIQNARDAAGYVRMKQRHVWVRREMRDTLLESIPDGQSYEEAPFRRWAEELGAGRPIASVIDHMPDAEQIILARQNVRSTALIPVFQGEEWWGFLRFDECRMRRTWLRPEIDAMQVGAETLGAAISRKRAEQDLIAERDRAERADSIKQAFIANMSHEVRTPLNIILGYLVLVTELSGAEENEEVHEFVQAIDDASQRLIRTVDSIMNISRFQTEDISLERAPLRFDKLIASCVEKFRHLADEKQIRLEFQNHLGEAELIADEHFLAESIEHLVDNAVKFTARGGVTITLQTGDADSMRLSVADTGIGISSEFMKRMYDPYMQEDIGYDRVYEGIGLGLTLVKLYLEAHGAAIDVQSSKGEGSTFVVTFPAAAGADRV